MAAALGWITASQFDQPPFDIPLDLDLVRPKGLLATQDGDVHALGDQLLADTGDRSQAGAQGSDDLLIGTFVPERIIGQQEDSSVGQFAGRRLAAGNHLFQVRPFLGRQSHPVLVHSRRPVLGVSPSADRQGTGYRIYPSNEDGRPTRS